MAIPYLYIQSNLLSEIEPILEKNSISVNLEPVECVAENWIEIVNKLSDDNHFLSVIIPSEWVIDKKSPNLDSLIERLKMGKVRLAFWGDIDLTEMKWPYYKINPSLPEKLLICIFKNLIYCSMPGLQHLLSTGTQLYADRINNSLDIGNKLDRCVSHATHSLKLSKSQNIRLRLSILSVLYCAFQNLEDIKQNMFPVQFQFAIGSDSLIYLSLKWKTDAKEIHDYCMTSSFWKVVAECTDIFWLQFIPEATSVETILIIDPIPTPANTQLGNAKTNPIGYGILTSIIQSNYTEHQMLNANHGKFKLVNELESPESTNEEPTMTVVNSEASLIGSNSEYVDQNTQSIPELNKISSDNVIASDHMIVKDNAQIMENGYKNSSNSQEAGILKNNQGPRQNTDIQLASLKVDHDRLMGVLKKSQEQNSLFAKRISELITAEKKAVLHAKSLEYQIKNNPAQKELSVCKEHLSAAKTREAQLIQKFNLLADQLKKLQSELKTKQTES